MDDDPRFQSCAFITNGTSLYEVIGITHSPGPMGALTKWVKMENCRTLKEALFMPSTVRASFELVRAAPECPDEIPAEAVA